MQFTANRVSAGGTGKWLEMALNAKHYFVWVNFALLSISQILLEINTFCVPTTVTNTNRPGPELRMVIFAYWSIIIILRTIKMAT